MVQRQDIVASLYAADPVRWESAKETVDYLTAVARMEAEADAIAKGERRELIWLLEHPALYTAGTSAKSADLVQPDLFPVFATGRGGQYTYHGPGQRVAYVMLDLKKRGSDVRAFIAGLERWIIATLLDFGITGETREDRVGVWVKRPGREDKIAALGIRVRRGISFHGLSININPDLSHFDGIVPCGVNEHGVTSFQDLGLTTHMHNVDLQLRSNFTKIFAPLVE